MTRLAFFDGRFRWGNPDGTLTREAQIFLRELWLRAGGTADFDLGDVNEYVVTGLGSLPPLVPQAHIAAEAADITPPHVTEQIVRLESEAASLRAELHTLRQEVAGLLQGTTL